MNPCTSFSSVNLPSASSLAALAATADDLLKEFELTTDQKLLNLINDPYYTSDPIHELFKDRGITTTTDLNNCVTVDEIETMYALMNWYHLACFGYLHDKDNPKHLEDTYEFLGIKNIFDFFTSKFNNLSTLVTKEKNGSDFLQLFLQEIDKALKGVSTAQNVTMTLEQFSQIDDSEYISSIGLLFDSEECRTDAFRLVAFLQMTSHFYTELDTSKPFQEQYPAIFASIPKELHRIFTIIENWIQLNKSQVFEIPLTLEAKSCTKSSLPTTVSRFSCNAPINFVRPDIPGIPNFMNNGGNTCYMSSTLWPLAYVIPDKVEECISKFEKNPPETQEIALAREAFTAFFRRLTSPTSETIKGHEVDRLRTALQKAFPFHFTQDNPKVQEDAHEFLNCIINELLKMDHGEGVFYISRVFTQANPEEELIDKELYNYEEALAPYYVKDGNLLTVKLHDEHEKSERHVTFSDLATPPRKSSEIIQREATQSADKEKPAKSHVSASFSDQYVLASIEEAPEFIISNLGRFAYSGNRRTKCSDPVLPSPQISFQIKGEPGKPSEKTVTYNLIATTVHRGETAERGHYYTYMRYGNEGKIVKYDDMDSCPQVDVPYPQVLDTTTKNGYIFYYRKQVSPNPEIVTESEDSPPL